MISLSLGTRIDAKRRPGQVNGGNVPVPTAPMPVEFPSLAGPGLIGLPVAVDPGKWIGHPAPVLRYQWLRDGIIIPGAEDTGYLPGEIDELALISCSVTASNAAGTATAASAGLTITQPPPVLRAAIADQFFILDSGVQTLDPTETFAGAALNFSVTGANVSVDPATGMLSIPTDRLLDGVSVTVSATNSGGEVTHQFRVSVAQPGAAPELVNAPRLVGDVHAGTEVTLDPGNWNGTPAPDLACQWLIEGDEIAGAVTSSHTPSADDEGRTLSCRVTAANDAGSAQAETAGRVVTLAPPQAAGALSDLVLDAGTGPATVAAAADFTGEKLDFTVSGPGAVIDSATGVVTIVTDDLFDDQLITVMASNSGGNATSQFKVTVRPVLPELVAAPTLSGDAQVGATVTVESGDWAGAPTPELALQWLCDGEEIIDATAASCAIDPEHDLKTLACRVTATNAAGSVQAQTAAVLVTQVPPSVIDALADVSLERGSEAHSVATAKVFSGAGLLFEVEGAGVTIDAETGVLVISTEIERSGEITVRAQNSGGIATASFKLAVTAPATFPVAPMLLSAPALLGEAKIGQALTVNAGVWSGVPAPQFAFQWLRDGADIEGAEARDYTLLAEDDLAEIACRVLASNTAGSADALSDALTATFVAPVAKGELLEEVFDQNSGMQEIEAGSDFVGENLTFSVSGAGAQIDPRTGMVTIPTDTPNAGALVTVAASNSGGAASSEFMVTIEEDETSGPLPAPAPDQWRIARSFWFPENQSQTFQPRVSIDPGLGVHAAQWTTSGQTPAPEEHWETLASTGTPNEFVTEMLHLGAGDWHLFEAGTRRQDQFRIRYKTSAEGAWSEEAEAKSVPAPEPVAAPPRPPKPNAAEWNRFFISPKAAYDRQDSFRYGQSGYQLQFMHCGDRSPVNPDKACFGEDVSALWITQNGTEEFPRWIMPACKGLGNRYSVSVKFDPEQENTLLYAVSDQSPGSSGGGIYRSTDLGQNFEKAIEISAVPGGSNSAYGGMYRAWREIIIYDPNDYDKWYFFNSEDSVYRSTDRGRNWSKRSSDPKSKNMGRCWKIGFHPGNGTIYAACETGLWRSTDDGSGWSKLNPAGLPSGKITSIDINPDNGNDIYAVVLNNGLYRSTNGGGAFSRVRAFECNQVFVSNADRNVIYLVATNQLENGTMVSRTTQVSTNGGNSWSNCDLDTNTYGWDYPNWQKKFNNKGSNRIELQGGILPHPTRKNEALATTKCIFFRTTNGTKFVNRSDGYDSLAAGHANIGNILFDLEDPDRMMFLMYDYGAFLTENGGAWFERRGCGSFGISHTAGQYSGSFAPGNPQKVITTFGLYSAEASAAITTNMGRSWDWPSALKNDKIGGKHAYNVVWASFHSQNENVCYTDRMLSVDSGKNWTSWWAIDKSGNLPTGEDAKVHGCAPRNGDVLFAFDNAQSRLFRTTDRGKNWAQYVGLGTSVKSQRQPTGFTMHPSDPATVYWWRRGDGLIRYNGVTETVLAQNLKGIGMDRVRISVLDPDVMYLMGGGNGESMAWRSTDAGRSWTDISFNLPRVGSNRGMELCPHSGVVFITGTAGTRILPPPGGHARFNLWANRFGG